MEGREIPGKSDIFYVDDLSMAVTRTKIMKVLREKFKAVNTRIIYKDGTRQRGLKISSEVLQRIKASYEDPWEVKILLNSTIEYASAQVNQPNQGLDQYVGQNNGGNQEQKTDSHEEAERGNPPIHTENGQKEALDGVENTPPISTEPGLPGLVGQSNSIKDIASKAMLDNEGNNKGYFTNGDFAFVAMIRPNEHWTDDEIEQTLQQLLREGKIVELEPGKYSPTSGDGGGNQINFF
jgi:hypothetical protein